MLLDRPGVVPQGQQVGQAVAVAIRFGRPRAVTVLPEVVEPVVAECVQGTVQCCAMARVSVYARAQLLQPLCPALTVVEAVYLILVVEALDLGASFLWQFLLFDALRQ